MSSKSRIGSVSTRRLSPSRNNSPRRSYHHSSTNGITVHDRSHSRSPFMYNYLPYMYPYYYYYDPYTGLYTYPYIYDPYVDSIFQSDDNLSIMNGYEDMEDTNDNTSNNTAYLIFILVILVIIISLSNSTKF